MEQARPHAKLVETCVLIRAFEQRLLHLFSLGKIDGTTHTSIGQEVNAVGILAHCEPEDTVVSNHRCHAHFIAHIGRTRELMAEIMGLPSGVCSGIGGSQHLCVPGRFYSNGIQGGIAPFAVGLAQAKKMRGEAGIVIVFIGDGTLGEGALYEAVNIAALSAARLLFVVEDNAIAQTTASDLTIAGDIAKRFEAFGLPVTHLRYPHLTAVHSAAGPILDAVRNGSGPQALVIRTSRLAPHSKGDDTRPAEIIAEEQAHDPFLSFAAEFGNDELAAMWEKANNRIDSEYDVLRAEKEAASSAEVALPGDDEAIAGEAPVSWIDDRRMNERIRDGLAAIMERNPHAILLGEDIAWPYGGAFKVTGDLSARFPERVWQMPISEAGIAGVAGGLSVGGCLPIAEIMFGDFSTLIVDQVVNHFAKFRQMYAGQVSTPGIIRLPMGGGRGYGPTHSQSLEKLFLGIPGLRVVAPSLLHPIGEMLAAASEQPYPTLFIENKLDYARRARFEAGQYRGFAVRNNGYSLAPTLSLSLTGFESDHFTLYVYGGMLTAALDALEELAVEDEIFGRLVCPSLLSPCPTEDLRSEQDGPMALVVEEGVCEYGWTSEIACALMGVRSPPAIDRLGARRHCIPAALELEKAVLPTARSIAERVRSHSRVLVE